jgi:ribose transport system ATP-binding protein
METSLATTPAPTLQLAHISKSFGGVHALRDVSLTVAPGEIHGLVGQNGSGKSTLIKILAGYHAPDVGTGSMHVEGEPVDLPMAPGHFRDLGIGFVHQDLALVETLTILENMRVGRYQRSALRPIRWREERKGVVDALDRFDLRLNPDWKVSRLSETEKALIAIVRAVRDVEETDRKGLLVLDEPTVYLPADSVYRLFDLMRQVTRRGIAILFVSHQLDEVKEITSTVTVLRDGTLAGRARTAELSEDAIIRMILGRGIGQMYPDQERSSDASLLLDARGIQGELVRDLSLSIRKGETVGVTGLLGMGWEEVPYLLFGATRANGGQVTIGSDLFQANQLTPEKSIKRGVVLVPANRLRDGVIPTLSVEDNVALPLLEKHFVGFRLRLDRITEAVRQVLRSVDVRPADPGRKVSTLSGGNQQKAVLGKWIQTNPQVLLLHEPTQGVDVGARKGIFQLVRDATKAGRGVLIASGENEDLGHLCDRVLIFRDGRVVKELRGLAVSAERIVEESYRTGERDTAGSHETTPSPTITDRPIDENN